MPLFFTLGRFFKNPALCVGLRTFLRSHIIQLKITYFLQELVFSLPNQSKTNVISIIFKFRCFQWFFQCSIFVLGCKTVAVRPHMCPKHHSVDFLKIARAGALCLSSSVPGDAFLEYFVYFCVFLCFFVDFRNYLAFSCIFIIFLYFNEKNDFF